MFHCCVRGVSNGTLVAMSVLNPVVPGVVPPVGFDSPAFCRDTVFT